MTTHIETASSKGTHRKSTRMILAGIAFALVANTVHSEPVPPSEGNGWPGLKSQIDQHIAATMSSNKIVGMTVAVTRNGKLVFSRGYGYAMKNGSKVTKMDRFHRTPIGSTGKALVSGPTVWEILDKKGMDPANTKLYGSNSIFGNTYATEQSHALGRFGKIAAVAVAPDDTVYSWARNGKVYKGWSRDLASKGPGKTYKLSGGMKPRDIRAIAIAGSSSKVYTFYNNGGRSVGTSTDLGHYSPLVLDGDGKPETKVKFPSGLNMYNVVGIAIAKSDDHVVVWYDNGTVSSGTSLDFTKYYTGRTYQAPTSGMRYDIIDAGIASDDKAYFWYGNGKTSTGWSRDLDKHRALADFKWPPTGPSRNPYKMITTGMIFAHLAGFDGSGDVDDTVIMFNTTESQVTYDQAHRQFMRTRGLRSTPGTEYSYSNHGFGLTTLMVPSLSGKSYRNYAINTYLKNFGLRGTVVPRSSNPTHLDAYLYYSNKQSVSKVAHTDSGTGLAAGGWNASAESMVTISNKLAQKWGWNAMDLMGWGRNSKGKLGHSGKTGGGIAYIAVFPEGYTANNGADLSDVHIAIATNTEVKDAGLSSLANKIALAVPESGIPANYDISGKPIN
jgi:CubicO group peptidase (beta-lactamase class C family)